MRRILALGATLVLLAGGCSKSAATGPLSRAPQTRSAVSLEISVSTDLSAVEGSLGLHYVNQETGPVDRVRFLLFPGLVGGSMDVTDLTVDGVPADLGGRQADAVRPVALGRSIAPGASADIACSWRAAVPAIREGGPCSRTDGFASLAWCFPVPLSPRSSGGTPAPYADFLCTDASAWHVRVSLPAGATLVASGMETARAGVDGRTVVDLELDPARDFYLAIGTDLSLAASRPAAGTVPAIRCLAPPGREPAAAFAADVAAQAIRIFDRRFGPYPYRGFTLLAGPLPALGIEFPGLTVVGEAIFSLSGSLSGTPMRTMLEATIAHEVAHQWFYNLVGNDQDREPWLDEAMAQYATRLYYLDRYGEAAAASYAESWQGRWNRVDRASTPIGRPVSGYTPKEYAAIVYGRGPLFIQALASAMGTATFDRFLKAYVERFRWQIASGSDFESMAEEQCRCDLAALFSEWVAGP